MNDQLPMQIRSRRSHNKSRAGCQNCKKRRVKCDEKKPHCTKCVRHSIECDFASPAASTSPDLTRRFRFRPSKYQSGSRTSSPSTRTEAVISSAASASTGVQCDLAGSALSGGISFADLKLYHHFVTSTYKTLADEKMDHRRVWSHHVPQWGISFPSVMHLILALSALHLAHEDPASRTQFIAQADDHFTFGVRSVSAVLCLLNTENCQLIYMSAALICLVYFGRGPRRGEYLVFSDIGRSEWLILLHGVRSIVTQNHDRVFTGVLEPIPDDSIGSVSDELQAELDEHLQQVRQVQAFIRSHVTDETSRTLFEATISDLLSAFEEVYKMRSAGKDGIFLLHLVVGWVYRLRAEMISLLEQKDRYALILFGHWSILLAYQRSSWLMQGWDAHVLHGVRTSLGEEDQQWLAWPIQVIEGGVPTPSTSML
ncbi:Zn(II)2Cys6 transcription factor domain-containing protein [Aspergillus luchuensis]|uniref:C6 finger domain protein n=1 Tax=Aspergillus kawachii TaxID=1069201 RepID=A0A146EYG5_ASPKA|nr:uncharacterized protein AKAW2_41314S [Aspergillus luchuensis]BCR99631.1 hypothetical protein AKAW2_41314S [Aspergillus luchuensis]BCS11923.1 hypothetical protein ALUC_41263S [Aspergillus luchuensis]GAT19104.1 C6 finger domain protein [Aspergillus luchuensis]